MHFSKLVMAVVAVSTALGSVCQAQVKDPAQLVGSWAQSDATGKIDTFLKVTCNDLWEATSPGKPAVPGRGAIRIISSDAGLVIAENRSLLGFNKQVATGPLKITQSADGATTMVAWAGKERPARLFQNGGEWILELKDLPNAYYVQCPVSAGKTQNDPWRGPPANQAAYYACQLAYEQASRNSSMSDRRARYTSYAQSWRDAASSLPAIDMTTPKASIDARWAGFKGEDLNRFMTQEIDRCGGAAPGFPEAQVTAASSAPPRAPPPATPPPATPPSSGRRP